MTAKRSNVLIIGGGIIGVACADELVRRGASVTLIDQRDIGHGCSYGNAGWITPCFALPLAMPGAMRQGLKWMMNPDSPFYIKPRLSLELLRWLWRFMRAANKSQMQRSAKALIELSRYSLDAYRQMNANEPDAFGFTPKGLLMIAETEAGYRAAVDELKIVSAHGISGKELTGPQLRAFEPAVVNSDVLGGVYFPDEAHLEPLKVVQWLARRAAAHGALLMPGTEAFAFRCEGKRVTGVQTTRGWIEADQIVLAAGSWSAPVGKMLRLRVPVLAGKGYSVVVPTIEHSPQRPLMLIDHKVAITPHADRLRIAGTMELVDVDESITQRRLEAMMRATRRYLTLPQDLGDIEIWRGLRPCTPDGVPIIGRSSHLTNLVIATGHQMLGMLLAPATGKLVADLVTGAKPDFDPSPFSPARF